MAFFRLSPLIVCLLRLQIVWTSPRGVQDGVADGGRELNPGFKIRVTQTALDYVESLAEQAMQDQFPRIRISDMHSDIQNGDIQLTNMRITNFRTPTKHQVILQPPDQVQWVTTDADINIHGDYEAHQRVLLSKLSSTGDFDAEARGVDFSLSFTFYKTDDGGLSVKSRECSAHVRSLTSTVHPKFSLASALMVLYKNSVVNQMRPLVADEMCQEARRFIDVELNKQLSTIPKKVALNQTNYGLKNLRRDVGDNRIDDGDNDRGRRPTTTLAPGRHNLQDLAKKVSKVLVLDYSILRDPAVTPRYLESMNRGEISYEGQGGTPFHPPDLQEPSPLPSDRMVYLTASDYVVNSLSWHAYKHGLLTFKADAQNTPQYKSLLKTSCDDDVFAVCIGSVVPEVGKSFPNSDVAITFQVVQAPAVYFRREGKIRFVAPSHIVAYAKNNGGLNEMITASLDVEGSMSVFFDEEYIKGNATVTKFKMNMLNNNIKDFTQEKLDDFSNMARGLFQDLANQELLKGLPLPTVDGAKLVRPVIRFFERTVRIETDVKIDEDVLTLLAIEALRNGNSKVTIDETQPVMRH